MYILKRDKLYLKINMYTDGWWGILIYRLPRAVFCFERQSLPFFSTGLIFYSRNASRTK